MKSLFLMVGSMILHVGGPAHTCYNTSGSEIYKKLRSQFTFKPIEIEKYLFTFFFLKYCKCFFRHSHLELIFESISNNFFINEEKNLVQLKSQLVRQNFKKGKFFPFLNMTATTFRELMLK